MKRKWPRFLAQVTHTWLRTSESAAEETNVIARPLVPNLPALPTCQITKQETKKTRVMQRNRTEKKNRMKRKITRWR